MFTIARGRGALSCLATLCIVFSVVYGADAFDEGAPGVLPPSSGQALTAPWQEQDIGTVDVPGGSSDSFGTLTITSAGDIGGAADRFHYVYQPLIGDGEIVARVAALVAGDPWSQAGVMIRESLSPSAQEMFVGATGGNGWVVQRRDGTTAGLTETSYGPSGTAPGWVRLVREGDRISAYVSADGATWTLVRAQTLTLPGTVYVGMAVSSHSSSLSAGVFMNVSVGQPTPSATVAITSPSAGSTFTAPATIPIAATVTTTNTSVSRVDFYGDGVMLGSDLSAPYSFSWSSVAAGAHTVSATAILNTGGSISAQPVSLSVSAPAPPGSGGSGSGGTWQEQDVGIMAALGGSSDSFDTITITSAGDIGGAADSFHFVYQPLTGDGEIVARVVALVARDPWSVAGVMIRESLTPSSQEMFVGASGGNGWVVQRRDGATSGLTDTSYGPSGTAPGWVRLVREGDRISGYVSADGATWTLVRAQTIPMPVTVYMGMAVASHSATATAGVFMNVTVQASTTGTPGSGGDPVPSASVTITSPSAGATYAAPATIAVTAAVTTSNTSVSRVDFYGDGSLIGSDASAPYSVTWSNVSAGTHTLSATALLTTGGSVDAQSVSVSVSDGGGSGSPSGPLTDWHDQDIGTVSVPGGSSNNLGTFTITSAGDIGGAADQFHFVYQPLPGDGEIVARVAALVAKDGWSQAGVMIREALTPSAFEMFVGATGGNGWVVQRRDGTTSGLTETTYGPAGAAPGWVRLVRAGDLISTYVSSDGATWTLVKAQTIPLPATAYVGLAVASHTSSLSAAVFMNPTLQASTTGTPDSGGQPVPSASISITSPGAGATFTAPATIAISAAVTTSNTSVSRVDFYGDGVLLGSDSSAPYTFTWNGVSAGTHAVSAAAVLTTGGSVSAQSVSISVGVPGTTSSTLIFAPPADESTTVTSYTFEVYLQGGAMPIASRNLGKPPMANGEISVDVGDLIDALPHGTYTGVVTAVGPGGSTASQPSPAFAK